MMAKKSKPLIELEKKMCSEVVKAAKIEGEKILAEIRKEDILDEKESEDAAHRELKRKIQSGLVYGLSIETIDVIDALEEKLPLKTCPKWQRFFLTCSPP